MASDGITPALRKLLKAEGGEKRDELAEKLYQLALSGHPTAITQVLGRIDGPIPSEAQIRSLTDEQVKDNVRGFMNRLLKDGEKQLPKPGERPTRVTSGDFVDNPKELGRLERAIEDGFEDQARQEVAEKEAKAKLRENSVDAEPTE
jgi:hypothetical protein